MAATDDIGGRLCAHLGYLFNEIPLEARFGAAAEAGFSRVEVPNPYGFSAQRLLSLLDGHGLQLVQINSHAGDAGRKEKGLACLPGREAEFRQSIVENVAYARQVRSEFVSVLAGVVPDGHDREEMRSRYLSNIGAACDAALNEGIDVLIEPISSGVVPGYMMNHPRFALDVMEALDRPNLYMLLDTFHAASCGIDPLGFLAEHWRKIGHLHLADFPGRHEPGTGSIDFSGLLEIALAAGYKGSLGLEYVPLGDTVSGLSWRSEILG